MEDICFFLLWLIKEFNGNWFGFLPFAFVSQTTPIIELNQLKNGDFIELNDGD